MAGSGLIESPSVCARREDCSTLLRTPSRTRLGTLLARTSCPGTPCAGDKCPRRCQQVRGNEQRPPTFVLPDMHALVSARPPKRVSIHAKHDVTERDGGHAAGEHRAVAEYPGNERTVDFEDAIDEGEPAVRTECRGHEEHADDGVRRRPEESSKGPERGFHSHAPSGRPQRSPSDACFFHSRSVPGRRRATSSCT